MNIAGLQRFTMVDYPGKLAATVFTRGCTFRCGFCHNPELVVLEEFIPLMDESAIIKFLKSRVGKLQGVCITGGEPTMNKDLPEFVKTLKDMGYAVKLDTNGSIPDMVEKLIEEGNLDYIAMDIKAALSKYSITTGLARYSEPLVCHSERSEESQKLMGSFANAQDDKGEGARDDKLQKNIKKSIDLIMSSGVDYEFRTTIVKPLHTVEEFQEVGELIKGAKRYYLQNFVKSKHIEKHNEFSAFNDKEIEEMIKLAKPFVKETILRI